MAASRFKTMAETVTLTDTLSTLTGIVGTVTRTGITVLRSVVKGTVLITKNATQSAIRTIRKGIVIKSNNK